MERPRRAPTYNPGLGTVLSAGIHTLQVTAASTANYNPASASVTLRVLGPGSKVEGTELWLVAPTPKTTVQITAVGASKSGATGVRVKLNGTSTTYNQSFTTVRFFGYNGDDSVVFASTLTLNVEILEGNGNNALITGKGNDVITIGDGNNTIVTGSGNKTIAGGKGRNAVTAGTGTNLVNLGNGNNRVQLGNGNNTVTLGNGNNTLTLGGGNNVAVTGGGTNVIFAGNGNNLLAAGLGQHTSAQATAAISSSTAA